VQPTPESARPDSNRWAASIYLLRLNPPKVTLPVGSVYGEFSRIVIVLQQHVAVLPVSLLPV
jgi:hypothetical protein